MNSSISRADLHVHTVHSDGASTPLQVLRRAQRRGLAVIGITDHDTITGALEAAEIFLSDPGLPAVVVGEEVSTKAGHIVGLFLTARVPPGLPAAETVARIHDQGGLAIAVHPFWRIGTHGIGPALLREVPFDAVEIANGAPAPSMWMANRKARRFSWEGAHVVTGSSDAHRDLAVGWSMTEFEGTTGLDLRRALEHGTTRAVTSLPNPIDLVRYVGGAVIRHPKMLAQEL